MLRVRYPLLVLDSSSPRLSIAVRKSARAPVVAVSVTGFTGHVRRLVPLAERALARAGVPWKAVRTVAGGLGPGSFTGLRVGLAAVKAFALAGASDLLGASSLSLTGYRAASRLARAGRSGTLAVMVNARREQAYVLLLRVRPGAVRPAGGVRLVPFANLPGLFSRVDWCTGDLKEVLAKRSLAVPSNVIWLDQALWYPDARNFFDILQRTDWVKRFTVKTLKPLYLHPPL